MHKARRECYTFTASNASANLKADNKSFLHLHWKEFLNRNVQNERILPSIKAAKRHVLEVSAVCATAT